MARFHKLRKNSEICHSEPRSVFERGEESASSLVSYRKAAIFTRKRRRLGLANAPFSSSSSAVP
jgi:hypothetical protein